MEQESSETVEYLHKEMNDWRNEHYAWLCDIQSWRREFELAELMLHKLDRILPNHNYALEKHEDAINQHKERIINHENNFKKYFCNKERDTVKLKNLIEEHRLQKAQHLNERQRHRAFSNSHHNVMAELMRITKMLESEE